MSARGEKIAIFFTDRQVETLRKAIGRQVSFHLTRGRLFLAGAACDAMGLTIHHWKKRERAAPIRGADFVYLGTRYFRPGKGQPELGLRVPVVLPRLPTGCLQREYRWVTRGLAERRHTTLDYIGNFQLFSSSGLRTLQEIEIYSDRDVVAKDQDNDEHPVDIDQRISFSFDMGDELIVEIGHWSDSSFLFQKPDDARPYSRQMETLVKRVSVDRPMQ